MDKKLLKILFAVVIAFVGIFTASSTTAVKGDVNGDNVCNAADVTALYNWILNNDNTALVNGDQNGDSIINAGDVTYVYNIILGNSSTEFEHVYILGNEAQWDPTKGLEMTTEDGITYTAVLDATNVYNGYSWFGFTTKLASADSQTPWEDIANYRFGAEGGGDFLVTDELIGQELSLVKDGYQAFQIPVGKWNLSVNLNTMKLIITKVEEPQPENKVYIVGEVNGEYWDINNGFEMTTQDGKVFEATVYLQSSEFYFTTALAESEDSYEDIADKRFGCSFEDDCVITNDRLNEELQLAYEDFQEFMFEAESGIYKLTVNLEDMTLTVSEVAVSEVAVYILGEVNGNMWNPGVGEKMESLDGKIFKATVTFNGRENNGNNYFAFTTKLCSDWSELTSYRFGPACDGNYLVTDELLDTKIPLSKNYTGNAVEIPAGKYELTLDIEEMTLIIHKIMPSVYILGIYGWDPSDGWEMYYDEYDKMYHMEIFLDNELNYFGFTTQLGDTWDEIAPYRFGGVGNGDVVLSTEICDAYEGELNLTKDNFQAFVTSEGHYDVAVDLKNMKMYIQKEPCTGDGPE